ncbi:MAG: endonuclease/exonuclease/phosphatase family protein, partial [Cyanobacteria bacterium]|nr:endonuclease/exonuclease/phosphatase family protein [Cyanobacteriota bacterium]MDW8201291.1 endonuclease/exonuclease/phosphatase family protein [Cyanobacteriota bacterium SKYGB_h_bin112]
MSNFPLQSPTPRWKGVSTLAIILTASIVAITLLAVISTHFGWWLGLELASHFQMQYAIAASLLLIGILCTRQKLASFLGLFCVALLFTHIVPWYLPSNPVKTGIPLRLLIANVNVKNRQALPVLSLIQQEQPDVIVLMEMNAWWLSQLSPLHQQWPYSFGQGADSPFGIAILSRIPLQQPQLQLFGTNDIPSIVTGLRLPGQLVTLVATHPPPPIQPDLFHERNRHLASAAAYIQRLQPPIVVAGDLNTSMWSPYYRRLIASTELLNARRGFGVLPTWPNPGTYGRNIPGILLWLLSIPIDHCLISLDLGVQSIHT